jgi:hypothetical protein
VDQTTPGLTWALLNRNWPGAAQSSSRHAHTHAGEAQALVDRHIQEHNGPQGADHLPPSSTCSEDG